MATSATMLMHLFIIYILCVNTYVDNTVNKIIDIIINIIFFNLLSKRGTS